MVSTAKTRKQMVVEALSVWASLQVSRQDEERHSAIDAVADLIPGFDEWLVRANFGADIAAAHHSGAVYALVVLYQMGELRGEAERVVAGVMGT